MCPKCAQPSGSTLIAVRRYTSWLWLPLGPMSYHQAMCAGRPVLGRALEHAVASQVDVVRDPVAVVDVAGHDRRDSTRLRGPVTFERSFQNRSVLVGRRQRILSVENDATVRRGDGARVRWSSAMVRRSSAMVRRSSAKVES